MIARMAKPEEVIVVEDENGNIVRETMKDTDTLARYKTMHETLVYLSNLGHEDTETQMLEQLKMQVSWKYILIYGRNQNKLLSAFGFVHLDI